jgi:hypothetical protein
MNQPVLIIMANKSWFLDAPIRRLATAVAKSPLWLIPISAVM